MTLPAATLIKKVSLHDQVVSSVRDLIIEEHLAPGARIEEVALAKHLGVSRTPLREALRTLAAEGLVVVHPSRGTFVHRLGPQEVHGMLEVLAELERLAGRLAMARATDEEIADLLALHDTMMAHYEKRRRMPYYKQNQAFHTRVTALSGNATLAEMQGRIQARLKRIRFIGNRDEDKWSAAVADHERMAVCVRERDGEGLGNALADHLAATWERVAESL